MQWLFLAAALALAGLLSGLIVLLVARRAGDEWNAALAYFGLADAPDPEGSSDLSGPGDRP